MKNEDYNKLRDKAVSHISESEIDKGEYKDLNDIIHELKVHQVELEIQNDELIETQRKLIDLNQKFYDLYNFAPLCYLTLNLSGDILESNFKSYEYFKLKKDDLISKSILNFVVLKDYDQMLEHIEKVKNTGTLQSQEIQFKDKYGEIFTGIIQSVINESKKQQIIYSAIIDITKEKEKEKEIENNYESIKKLMNNMQEIVFIINSQGIIKLANEKLIKLTGIGKEDIQGKEFISLITSEKRIDSYKKLNQLYNKDHYEATFTLKNVSENETDFEIVFNKGIWENNVVYFCSGRELKKESENTFKINDVLIEKIKTLIKENKNDAALKYINKIKGFKKENKLLEIENLNILLVEDNRPDNIEELIESFNKKITIMPDIYKAYDEFKDNYYNIIILKISSGEMSKLEFLKKIKKDYDIPVIGIFSDFNKETIRKFIDAGLDDFIIKPILKSDAIKNTIINIIK